MHEWYAAPMEGLTGWRWRQVQHEMFGRAALYVTPFVSPNGNFSFQRKELEELDPERNRGIPVVPQILTNGKGGPDRTSTTMIMYLNNHLFSKNYGMAGAVSVVLFLVCAVLCVVVYFSLTREDDGLTKAQRRELKAARKAAAKGGK